MKLSIKLGLASAFLLAAPASALAAATEWFDMAGGRLRVVIADPLAGEPVLDGMLQLDLLPGWKTYWRDPGEAGVPLQFDLSGSGNATLAGLDFPAPERFDDGVTVWAGYQHPVAIGFHLIRSDAAKPSLVKGSVFLGVCEHICVPVQYQFSLDVADVAGPTVHHELVAMALAGLPKPATADFGLSAAVYSEKTLTVTAAVPPGADRPELFMAAPDGMQLGKPELESVDGPSARFSVPIPIMKRSMANAPLVSAYTLVSGDKAVSGSVALTAQ